MILVTGGLGFLGAHTARALLDLGAEVVLAQRRTDNVPAFLRADVGRRAVVAAMDCTDADSVRRVGERHRITGLVHLAAPRLSQGDALDELRAATAALFTVAAAARSWGVERLTLASTIGVYAGVDGDAYREDASLPVTSPHPIQATKKSAEILASALAARGGPEIISARIGAAWGPGGRSRSPFFGAPQLIHAAARATALDGPAPYADEGIDMIYAPDCGRAIALLQTAPALRHATYNVGSGQVTTNADVAAALAELAPGAVPALAPGRGPHAPTRDAYLNITRLRADTGFAPAFPLGAAVADYVNCIRHL